MHQPLLKSRRFPQETSLEETTFICKWLWTGDSFWVRNEGTQPLLLSDLGHYQFQTQAGTCVLPKSMLYSYDIWSCLLKRALFSWHPPFCLILSLFVSPLPLCSLSPERRNSVESSFSGMGLCIWPYLL